MSWRDVSSAMDHQELQTQQHKRKLHSDDKENNEEGTQQHPQTTPFVPPRAEWLGDNGVKVALCPVPFQQGGPGTLFSATMLSNNTKLYTHFCSNIVAEYEKYSDLEPPYSGDPLLLTEAHSNLYDLISEHMLYGAYINDEEFMY